MPTLSTLFYKDILYTSRSNLSKGIKSALLGGYTPDFGSASKIVTNKKSVVDYFSDQLGKKLLMNWKTIDRNHELEKEVKFQIKIDARNEKKKKSSR